jgi:hypothetical protein
MMVRIVKIKTFYLMYYDSSPRGRRQNDRGDSSRRSREHRGGRRSPSRERGSQTRRHRFLLLMDARCKRLESSIFLWKIIFSY